ncbi:MAG: M3 family oligoendopeptidase [Candidatus Odinarchaeota archaeon]
MVHNIAWDLSTLFKGLDDPEIENTISWIKEKASSIVPYKGKITSEMAPEDLLEMVQNYEATILEIRRVYSFANLSAAVDQNNKEALALFNTIQNLRTGISKQLSFVKIELGNLLGENGEKYLASPILVTYRHYLKKMLRGQPHILSELEEQLIIEKNQFGVNAWSQLQEQWVGTRTFDIQFPDGKIKTIPFGEYKGLAAHPDRAVRKEVIKKVMGGLGRDAELYVTCLRSVCADHLQTSKRRKFSSPMESSFLTNDVTKEMVESMVAVVEANVNIFQEVLRLKAKLLGTGKNGKLQGEDFLFPLPSEGDRLFSWANAKKLVVESYAGFDSDFGVIARQMFDNNRIDASPRIGKRVGAFCAPDYKAKSAFILTSFTGTVDSIMTVAHEMGHAVHQTLAARQQTYFNSRTSFVLAETASNFGEMILGEKLLVSTTNDEIRRTVLLNRLLDTLETVFEVGSRIRIEESFYKAIENGEYLDAKKASELFNKGRQKYFGDAVEWLEEQVYEWCWKPHYYMHNLRFYNYPYVFANLSVLALYAKYRKEGKAFIPKLKQFLAAGGSRSPLELGKEIMGVNMGDASFWELGVGEIRKTLEEVKKLF